MISKLTQQNLALAALVLCALAGFGWSALAGSKKAEKPEIGRPGSEPSGELSGEELWTMNCRRCHNIRPSTMYSNAQWDVIVHHMRVRANITGEEQRAIVEFLKSSK